jgi:hypothetical protein
MNYNKYVKIIFIIRAQKESFLTKLRWLLQAKLIKAKRIYYSDLKNI